MKKSVVSLVLAAVSCPALPADSSLDRVVGCADIRDSRERLACFDREVAPLAAARSRPAPSGNSPPSVARNPVSPPPSRTPAGPPPAPAPVPAQATPTAPAAASSAPAPAPRAFGDEQLRPKDRAEPPAEEQVLHARIERLRTVTTSQFIVYLDNGQAWRHEDVVNGEYLRVGDAVTLTKGALGSYRLTRDAGNSKNWIRVSRVK